ncbi:MAG: hypothetical protein ACKOAY_00825 [Haliscomenobacter sp.]
MPKLTNQSPADVSPTLHTQMQELFSKVLDSLDRTIDEERSQEQNVTLNHYLAFDAEFSIKPEAHLSNQLFFKRLPKIDDVPERRNHYMNELSIRDLFDQAEEPQPLYKVLLKTRLERTNPPQELQDFLLNIGK